MDLGKDDLWGKAKPFKNIEKVARLNGNKNKNPYYSLLLNALTHR